MPATELATAYVALMPTMQGAQSTIATALAPVAAQATKVGDEAGKNIGAGVGSGLSGVAKTAGALFAADKIGDFFAEANAEAREAHKVGALTEQIIKATGGTANLTAEQVGNLSTALSNKAGVDDEVIQQGANLLLTFKNVANEAGEGANIFDRATASAVDLSAAGFGSVDGSAKMLGKALNDPLKGLSALGRAGVTFTDQQKEQVAAMVAAGDTLGAQKLILGEVESQVGGAAAASATSAEKMSVAWGNFQESAGTMLLPLLERLSTIGVAAFAWASENPAAVQALAITVGVLTTALVLNKAASVATGLAAEGAATRTAASWVASAARTVAALAVSAAQTAALWAMYAAGALRAAATSALAHARMVAGWVASGAAAAAGAARTVAGWVVAGAASVAQGAVMLASMAATAAGVVAGWVVMGVQSMIQAARMAAAWFIALGPVGWAIAAVIGLVALIVANWDTVSAATAAAWQAIVGWVTGAWQAIVGWVTTAVENVKAVIAAVFAAIVLVITLYVNAWRTVIETVWNAIKAAVSAAVGFVKSAIDGWASIAGKVGDFFGRAKDAITDKLGAAVDFVKGIPGKVVSAFGNVGDLLYDAGDRIIGGFLRGLKNAFENVKDFVGGIGSWIADHKGPKNYDLALLVPAGRWIMTGLRSGIADELPALGDTLGLVSSTITAGVAPRLPVYASPLNGAPGAGGGNDGGVHFHGNVGWDPDEVASRIETKRRDAAVVSGLASLATVGVS